MSYTVHSISQLAGMLKITTVALRERIARGAMPKGVTVQKIGSRSVIYIPQGKRIARLIDGKEIIDPPARPGRSVEWVLMDS